MDGLALSGLVFAGLSLVYPWVMTGKNHPSSKSGLEFYRDELLVGKGDDEARYKFSCYYELVCSGRKKPMSFWSRVHYRMFATRYSNFKPFPEGSDWRTLTERAIKEGKDKLPSWMQEYAEYVFDCVWVVTFGSVVWKCYQAL
jgi:hypothetical protein